MVTATRPGLERRLKAHVQGDVLLDARLDNRERFKQMALEEKAGFEARLVPSGTSHTFLPVVMLMPVRRPQGGALQGAPNMDIMLS